MTLGCALVLYFFGIPFRKILELNAKEEHNKQIRELLKRRGNRKICDDDYIRLISFLEKKPYLKK